MPSSSLIIEIFDELLSLQPANLFQTRSYGSILVEVHADCLPTGNCGLDPLTTSLQAREVPSSDRTVLDDPQKIFARMTALNGQLEFEYQPEVRRRSNCHECASMIDHYGDEVLYIFAEYADPNFGARRRPSCAVQCSLDAGSRLGAHAYPFSTPSSTAQSSGFNAGPHKYHHFLRSIGYAWHSAQGHYVIIHNDLTNPGFLVKFLKFVLSRVNYRTRAAKSEALTQLGTPITTIETCICNDTAMGDHCEVSELLKRSKVAYN